MIYFKKELVHTRLFRKSGTVVEFEPLADTIGLLETDDEVLIDELRGMIKQQRGGVVEIDEGQFAELKKNPPVKRLPKRFFDSLRVANQAGQSSQPEANANESVAEASPATTPTRAPRKVPITEKLSTEQLPPPKAPSTQRWENIRDVAEPEMSSNAAPA